MTQGENRSDRDVRGVNSGPAAASNRQARQAEAEQDRVLIERARTGDQRAFREIVDRHQRRAFAIALGARSRRAGRARGRAGSVSARVPRASTRSTAARASSPGSIASSPISRSISSANPPAAMRSSTKAERSTTRRTSRCSPASTARTRSTSCDGARSAGGSSRRSTPFRPITEASS